MIKRIKFFKFGICPSKKTLITLHMIGGKESLFLRSLNQKNKVEL